MMAPGHVHTRDELSRMKRSDIQKLCKDYGLRANMKTETLIEELLETLRSNIAPLVPPPQPQQRSGPVTRRSSTRSRTSSRSTTIRTRGSSGSSLVTTDIGATTNDEAWSGTETAVHSQEVAQSRTRKAKDAQFRLGVGRPVAAGGSGARSVTRSASKHHRTRVSKSVKVVEETIPEVPEQEAAEQQVGTSSTHDAGLIFPPPPDRHDMGTMGGPLYPQGPSYHDASPYASDAEVYQRLSRLEMMLQNANFKHHFESLQGLPSEVAWLKHAVQERDIEINNLKSDLHACRLELLVVRNETAKLPYLENQMKAMKEAITARFQFAGSNPGTPGPKGSTSRRVSVPLGENNMNATPQRPSTSTHPSDENVAPLAVPVPTTLQPVTPPSRNTPAQPGTTLGKRPRDSTSELAGALDDSGIVEKETPRRTSSRRPSKKAKLAGSDGAESAMASSNGDSQKDAHETCSTTSGPSTIPPIGTPPPTDHLPEYYAGSTDDIPQIIEGGENDEGKSMGFGSDSFYPFTFGASSSTPRSGETYPYFDAAAFSPGSALKVPGQRGASGQPQAHFSPMRRISSAVARPRTPARNSGPERFRIDPSEIQGMAQDMDPFSFQMDDFYGMEYPARDQPPPPSTATTIPQLQFQFGIGFGPSSNEGGSSPVQPNQHQKTMYGTELANDTRFGDFGRDKIASTSGKNLFWGGMY